MYLSQSKSRGLIFSSLISHRTVDILQIWIATHYRKPDAKWFGAIFVESLWWETAYFIEQIAASECFYNTSGKHDYEREKKEI